jgi:beta-N-acetylhexosaminidase
VIPPQSGLNELASQENQQVSNDVASQAVTLINPASGELDTVMPQPPDRNDKIVFFTDTLTTRQCSQCADENILAADALQNSVLKYYGPQVSGQASTARLSSYTFQDLNNLLNGVAGEQTVEDDLRSANWLVFSILDTSPSRPDSNALKRLLTERPDYLQKNQRVIVFSFNAPNYLDATDISKLTAYYGFYSKIQAFIDVAARILYREVQPGGQLPITVPGVGYDLSEVTSPDPGQVIPLFIDTQVQPISGTELPVPLPTLPNQTLEPTEPPTFTAGDTIPIRTGIIRDHNRHPVPDGTPVRFMFIRNGDLSTAQQIVTTTQQGSARASYKIENDGLLEIRVSSDPALTSEIFTLNISKGISAGVTAIVPSPLPTETPQPTPTPTLTPTFEPTPVPVVPMQIGFGDWLLAMLIIAASAIGVYFAGVWWGSVRWGVRWALCAVMGGALVYAYLALDMPGVNQWIQSAGRSAVLGLTLVGVMLGWGGGLAWRFWLEQKAVRKLQR